MGLSLAVACLVAAIVLSPTAAVTAPREDAVVECLIGKAAISLRNQAWSKKAVAADAAMRYAAKRCKGGQISEAGGDFVHSTWLF